MSTIEKSQNFADQSIYDEYMKPERVRNTMNSDLQFQNYDQKLDGEFNDGRQSNFKNA